MHKITAVGKYFSICFPCIHQPTVSTYVSHPYNRSVRKAGANPRPCVHDANQNMTHGPQRAPPWPNARNDLVALREAKRERSGGSVGRWVGGPIGRMGDGWHGHVCRISLRIAAGYVGQHFSANPPFTNNNNNNSSGKKGPARNEGPWSWVESRPKWHSG